MKLTGNIDTIETTVPIITGCLQKSSKSFTVNTGTSVVDAAVVVVAFVRATREYF